jgi:hypothetical protein
MLVALVACSDEGTEGGVQTQTDTLPTSTSAVMESLINHSADPLFAVSWGSPTTEEEWIEIEQMARQLELGGTLLPFPGTGPLDGEWTSDAAFVGYAQQLTSAAGRALNAAQSRREQELLQVGGEISAVCNSCHRDFAPGLPVINLVN